ncbi:phage Gp37/Gp68 family protein [bacterium]|nr:MAG: phage Gp37/Gp68 family protein [bacterium]
MADQTKIEWCDATLNLWWGCTKVSGGCKFCYAEELADHRYHKGNWGPTGTRREVKSWRTTLNKISARAKAEGRRLRVFCQSMSDTFEGPETMGGKDSQNWITVQRLQDELLTAVLDHPELDFLLLTKRPENVVEVCHRHDESNGVQTIFQWPWPKNLWIGTSVEDQATADERIPQLMAIPAAVRFLSCEPLLGAVDLTRVSKQPWHDGDGVNGLKWIDALNGYWEMEDSVGHGQYEDPKSRIDWVICGGESGPKARPMNPSWALALRDQCVARSVPFLFKQWGEFLPDTQNPEVTSFLDQPLRPDYFGAIRVGKHRAGRTLDGRTWDEHPEVDR